MEVLFGLQYYENCIQIYILEYRFYFYAFVMLKQLISEYVRVVKYLVAKKAQQRIWKYEFFLVKLSEAMKR